MPYKYLETVARSICYRIMIVKMIYINYEEELNKAVIENDSKERS